MKSGRELNKPLKEMKRLCAPAQAPTPPFETEGPALWAPAEPSLRAEAEHILGPSSGKEFRMG